MIILQTLNTGDITYIDIMILVINNFTFITENEKNTYVMSHLLML